MKLENIIKARKRINKYICKTPLEFSFYYSEKLKATIYLKLENLQVTKSFKIRGAFNKLLQLSKSDILRGVVTASAGNHGKGIAYASQKLGIKSTIFVPSNAPKNKIEAIKKYGGTVKICEGYYEDAEKLAKEYSQKTGAIFVSPYNDIEVIYGQGTISLEILEDFQEVDIIVVPIGGGGLISGISFAAKKIKPDIKIYGVQSSASPVMYESLRAGKIIKVNLKPSIAEGLHGQIEENTITFEIIKKYVDKILLVEEEEIKKAIINFIKYHNQIGEGAGVVGLAALEKYKESFSDKKVVVVISGGNIDFHKIKELICQKV